MGAIPDAEAAARARAAMGYKGFTYEQLAAASDVSYDTLRALMGRTSPRGATLDRLYAIADACGVPRRFMDEGFVGLEADDRLRAIEERLTALEVTHPADDHQASLVAATRRTKRALVDQADEPAAGSAAAGSTRDEAGASEEVAPAPSAATPRSAPRTGQ